MPFLEVMLASLRSLLPKDEFNPQAFRGTPSDSVYTVCMVAGLDICTRRGLVLLGSVHGEPLALRLLMCSSGAYQKSTIFVPVSNITFASLLSPRTQAGYGTVCSDPPKIRLNICRA